MDSKAVVVGLSLAFSLVALGSVPANARPGPAPSPRAEPTERLENRLLTLGLDEATRKHVFAILDGARPAARELRVQIRSAQQTLGELMKKEEPAEAAVLKQVDEIGSLMTKLRKNELATMLAVRAKLTPEQRAKLRPEHASLPGKSQGGCAKKAAGPRNISLGILPL